ncbi:MAG: hypothetical protein ACLVL2_17875 [Bacteroides cellulosilyticus]
MTEQEKMARKTERKLKKWEALGGQPKKVVARLDPIQFKRAEAIRDKFGFKSIYEMSQYLWGAFLRVAGPDNDTSVEPRTRGNRNDVRRLRRQREAFLSM